MINITDEEFRMFSKFIKQYSGINLKDEKKTLLVSRLSSTLDKLGMKSFTEYYEYIRKDYTGKELSRLFDCVTTNHTFFMRETQHFKYFYQIVLPYLKKSVRNNDIRIWCCACSSGEEPYTLAMILADFFKNQYFWNKKLLATDLSNAILEKAKTGIYQKEQIGSLPPRWVLNYFNKITDSQYQIKESIKREVIFRRFNLLENTYPFKKKFHVIFCRNVMIYFDDNTKKELEEKLYDCLEYGGYLFIGHSESIDRDITKFKYICPAVYRKI